MSFGPREYLRHIVAEADYLIEHSRGLSSEHIAADETLRRAFVRSLEIIGEAVKQVPKSVRDEYPEVEWRSMARMRDRLIHGYFSVDYQLVWDVVRHKIPALRQQVLRMLDDLA